MGTLPRDYGGVGESHRGEVMRGEGRGLVQSTCAVDRMVERTFAAYPSSKVAVRAVPDYFSELAHRAKETNPATKATIPSTSWGTGKYGDRATF